MKIVTPSVAPSLLAAKRDDLVNETLRAIKAKCSLIHFDVMDGKFVPNTSFSLEELRSLRDLDILKDVHIMIEEPERFAKDYIEAGADLLTFHLEALADLKKAVELARFIKSKGVLAGISIKPNTSVETLFPYLEEDDFDLVLVMSVEPGKGGQAFIENSLDKISALKEFRGDKHYLIEVDGGINYETGRKALNSGADILVAGSYLYGHDDFEARIRGLLDERA